MNIRYVSCRQRYYPDAIPKMMLKNLFYAIKMLGFDEVVEHTDIDAQLVKEALLISESAKEFNFIESFCPVVNELISKKYSILGENVLQLQYPSEICAKQIRKRLAGKKVGIFNLCECEANLALAKYPYGNEQYEVDHALSLTDMFPQIRPNLHKGRWMFHYVSTDCRLVLYRAECSDRMS
jgi:hypothetical protein